MEMPRWTVGDAIKKARDPRSIRRLARDADVSPAQLSRIERGEVQRPSAETLVAVARALWRSPVPLLILSGHIPETEARQRLLDLLKVGTEVYAEWMTNPADVESARRVLADAGSALEEVHSIAFDAFVGEPLVETAWDDSFFLLAAPESNKRQRDRAQLWSQLTVEREQRVMDYLRDQAELSRLDLQRRSADLACEDAAAEDREGEATTEYGDDDGTN